MTNRGAPDPISVRRRWIFATFLLGLVLVAALSGFRRHAEGQRQTIERNGVRERIVPKYGLFPVVRSVPVPGLNVTADLKAELGRLHLALPADALPLMGDVERNVDAKTYRYWLAGPISRAPLDAVTDFARWGGKTRLVRFPEGVQLTGTLPDGKTELYVAAFRDRRGTVLNVGLTVPRP